MGASDHGDLAVAMVRLNRFDIFDVEITQAVRLQVECNEHGQVIEAVLDVCERVARDLVDALIVPNAEVQLKQTRLAGTSRLLLIGLEKVCLTDAALLTVPFVYVDRDNCGGSGYDGRIVIQEVWLSQLIFANLINEIDEALVLIIVQDSQVPLERLHG